MKMLIVSNRNTLRSRLSRKGFTLIELLAVIVILAIIALIAVPQVIKILNKARMSAALDSSEGYIKAVENKIVLEEMKDEENKITDGTYLVKNLNVDYKGKGPSSGVVVVEKMNIKNARLCINNYSIDYDGEKSSISGSNYCDTDSKLIISVNGNEEEIALTDSLTYNYTLTSDILNSSTNISCNNSAVPSIDGNSLKIDNVYGNTLCSINKTLKESIDNTDTSLTNIIMVNDESNFKNVDVKDEKNIILNLNGKKLTGLGILIYVKNGSLILNGDGVVYSSSTAYGYSPIKKWSYNNSHLVINGNMCNSTDINSYQSGTLIYGNSEAFGIYYNSGSTGGESSLEINGGCFVSSENSGVCIDERNNNKAVINGGLFIGKYGLNNYQYSNLVITGGKFIGTTTSGIYNYGNLTIEQNENSVYITSNAQEWKPALLNGAGEININGKQADNCTNNYNDTKEGLCIYAEGDKNYQKNTANGGIQNLSGFISLNGGTIYGGHQGVNNGGEGIFNINNSYINSSNGAVLNNATGSINICNSKINSSRYDIYNMAGVINYSDSVMFTNGIDPVIIKNEGTINKNYSGLCK